MLVAITKPHQQFPVPLAVADYELSTSDDGDERGRVTLPPGYARSGVMTQIGDELIVYCTQLSKTIWRGQIERIEEARDGSITWHALGFGALQRDARISVVHNVADMQRWKPVGAGLAGGGYTSRPDLWDYFFIPSAGEIAVKIQTKRAFLITNATLFFIAFLYNQPERYISLKSIERLLLGPISFSGRANGVLAAPIIDIPQPPTYVLVTGPFTFRDGVASVIATPPCYGWVVGVSASGLETDPGTTWVSFTAIINDQFSGPIEEARVSAALVARGGCCDVRLPDSALLDLEKPDANLREIIENTFGRTPARYHIKRFLRDRPLTVIDFRTDSPLVWRFPETTRVVDISKAPNRVFTEYRGLWADHLTATISIPSLESRRQLARRFASVGKYNSKALAEERRDKAAVALDRQIAPLTIELDNSRYELMTREGVTVPNWAADVSDYAIAPSYYRNAKITSRVITRERTTYTVSFNPDDFVTVLRG